MISRTARKMGELVREEAAIALPAAIRAARHAGKTFLKKFPEEYARERKKNR